MKLQHTLLTIVALGASAVVASAQDAPAPQPGGPEGGRRVNPIVAALDVNNDGTIDSDELGKAAESLKKLDKNNDGKLERDEVRPARGEGRGGEGRGGRRGGDENKPQ